MISVSLDEVDKGLVFHYLGLIHWGEIQKTTKLGTHLTLVLVIRFNDFGADGGPAAKELAPKLDLTKAHLSSRLGVALPNIEVLHSLLVALSS